MVMKKALMMSSVASMIDLFNMDNIKTLRNIGFKVDVACNFEHGSTTSRERVDAFRKELECDCIKTFHVPVPRRIYRIIDIYKSYKFLKALCEKNHYQIVHCHSPIGGVIARLACMSSRNNGTKVIYTAHGFHFFKGSSIKNWVLFYPIEKLCAKYTDCLITINKEDFVISKRFKAKKTEHVPGIGIYTKTIQNLNVDKKAKRSEFGFNCDDFVLISVGELSKRKNQEVIIKSLSCISNSHLKLLVCGLGEYECRLNNLIKKLNLDGDVVLAGYRSDVKELLHSADCFVFPSLQEGLPVALMEAMSAGLPVVCSKIRGNTDLIKDGKGGFLFDPYDVYGLSESINKLMNSSRLCKKMGQHNIEEVKIYDIDNLSKEMTRIYEDVMHIYRYEL